MKNTKMQMAMIAGVLLAATLATAIPLISSPLPAVAASTETGVTPPWVTILAMPTGEFQLRVDGGQPPGLLGIEASTNLSTWWPVFTNATPTNIIFYTDADVGRGPMRFYRAYRASDAIPAAKIFSPAIGQVTSGTVQKSLPSDFLPQIIDLTPNYEKPFGNESQFDGLPVWTTLDGLPFHLGGRVELFGTQLAMAKQVRPKEVLGIKIGGAFEELHLIHDAAWSEVPDRAVATIHLHYADGVIQDFPIKYNVHVLDWNRMPSEETEVLTDQNTKIVWRGQGVAYLKGVGRLFKTVLDNPRPTVPVVTMDLISTDTRATYRLVAATIARHDSQRAVTPGLPLNQPGAQFDGTLKVTVVDADTGAPIAGADVYPYTQVYGVGIVIAPQLTSADGEVVIRYPVDGTEYIGYTVSKLGNNDGHGNWRRGNIPSVTTSRIKQSQPVVENSAK